MTNPPENMSAGGLPQLTIRCREHGPLVVELPVDPEGKPLAGLQVNDHLGESFPLPTHKRAVALCRCGGSNTRPFCDGSHREAAFRAAETAPPSERAAASAEKLDENSPPEGNPADPPG